MGENVRGGLTLQAIERATAAEELVQRRLHLQGGSGRGVRDDDVVADGKGRHRAPDLGNVANGLVAHGEWDGATANEAAVGV